MNKLLSLLKRNRFYVALLGGIVVIGAGYYFSTAMLNAPPVELPDKVAQATPPAAIDTALVVGNATIKPTIKPTPKPTATPTAAPKATRAPIEAVEAASNATDVPKEPTRKLPEKIISPVEGEIIVGFSGDGLLYSKTLGDWRTHSGIDIKAPLTTPVKCAWDGVVEKVYTDDALGITIIIDHQNTMKTVYANLSTDSMVKVGQAVKQGAVISGIGDTATFETGDVGHLHFEVLIEGKNVNPEDWIIK